MSILTHEEAAPIVWPAPAEASEPAAGPDVIAPNARRIHIDELSATLRMQQVPRRHWAYVCPVCGTVQSVESLVRTGLFESDPQAERYVGCSCVRRLLAAGRQDRDLDPDADPCFGCDWTRGGFMQLCRLVVVDHEGVEHPIFEPATKDQAQALRLSHLPPLVVPEELVAPETIDVPGRWAQL